MTLSSHDLAICALLATSLLVRVLPVFLKLNLSVPARALLDQFLPMAVFLNFSVYIIWTEIRSSPFAAIIAIAIVAILTLSTRAGLILTTCLGTLFYIGAQLIFS